MGRIAPGSQRGFTLIELLIVMVIIAILAAVAIPLFLGRRVAANDASAKQMASTGEHAAVIYSINSLTGYAGVSPAALKAIEPSINTLANGQTVLAAASQTATGFTLAAVSAAGDTFTIANSNGVLSRTCTIAAGNGNSATNTGGGCNHGTW